LNTGNDSMATSASQTYIARLGFQDRDRSNERHGLACEYLFERMLELEVAPDAFNRIKGGINLEIRTLERVLAGEYVVGYSCCDKSKISLELASLQSELSSLTVQSVLATIRETSKVGECVNVPIVSRSYVNGFADVLIGHYQGSSFPRKYLGEVKITKEPAENVLQQINFYLSYLDHVESVYIVTDYDPGDLKRLCVGTKIKVYRLGQVFEQWLASRTNPVTEEI